MRLRIRVKERPSDVTVLELLGLIAVWTLLWPIGVYLFFRQRVIQNVVAGYREPRSR